MRNPYIVGQPVKGERFYGREELIREILESPKDCYCILASRRYGKTSLLRQLEHLTSDADSAYLSLFWDFQGCQNEDDLRRGLLRGMIEARGRLRAVGLESADVRYRAMPLFDLLLELWTAAIQQDKKLLLLCDECESLIPIGAANPALLSQLRSHVQQAGVRTVLAGSRRLAELSAIGTYGSPFLHGFEPLIFAPRLSDADADALIRQSKTGDGLEVPENVIADIKEKTYCHPYLIQAVCGQLWVAPTSCRQDAGRMLALQEAYDRVMAQFGDHAFADDFRYLSPMEKNILLAIFEAGDAAMPGCAGIEAATLRSALLTLQESAYVKSTANGFALANHFFRRWLHANKGRLDEIPSAVSNGAIEKAWTGSESAYRSAIEDYLERHHARRGTLVIMLTDMQGSTEIADRRGDAYADELRRAHDALLTQIIQRGEAGLALKNLGDGMMAVFLDANVAVRRALEIQAALRRFNVQHPDDENILVRIGLHAGEVSVEQRDVFGSNVVIAARVCAIANGGQIFMTERVFVDAQPSCWNDLGERQLKGLKNLVRVFEVVQ
jgi:class 3 adenylate cyclase